MMKKIPILLYHDIESSFCPNEKTGAATKGTVVAYENFEKQIKYLASNNFQTISLDDFFLFRTKKIPIPSKAIIITFDDGHISNYISAFPVLKKYNFKATFFLVADRINERNHMCTNNIWEMLNSGMEIGSHGLTHKFLPLMDTKELAYEVHQSKQVLEDLTERTLNYFAFPGGHFNDTTLCALKSVGYKGACSCLQGLNNVRTNPFLLKRIEIRKSFHENDFQSTFSPLNILFYQMIDLWKSAIRQALGLESYARLRSKLYKYYIFKR